MDSGRDLRQAVLSRFAMCPTFVTLRFKRASLADDENEARGPTEMQLNAAVLMSLTTHFDNAMGDVLSGKPDASILDMPFGECSTFQDLVAWILYGKEPEDVSLQQCIECARFYSICTPDTELLDRNGFGEEILAEGCEDLEEDVVIPEGEFYFSEDGKILVLNERTYRRRWRNRNKSGWYYRCVCESCSGSVLVEGDSIRVVSEHSEVCRERQHLEGESLEGETQEVEKWKAIEKELRELVLSNMSLQSFDLLTIFLREHEDMAPILLTSPLLALLQYISALKCDTSLRLEERLTQSAGISEGCIIYQQVLPSKLVCFSFKDLRNLAGTVRWLLIDGTFRTCPKQFYQCVTLLSLEESTGVFFPICHCLLPDKTLETYMLMFSILDASLMFDNLEFITIDFERALIKAVRIWTQRKQRRIRILGCKFHFAKALNKHFKRRKKRKLSELEREFIHLFLVFPFLCKGDIEAILKCLSTVKHRHEGFVKYFTKNWMKDDLIGLWNFSDMDDDGLITRYTNNAIEAFHKRMSLELSPHPSVQRFLRWVEMYGKERHQVITSTEPGWCTRDADKSVDRREAIFRWMQLLQEYPTREEFRVLAFSFTCHCGVINDLAGRRWSHLFCRNSECDYSRGLLTVDFVFTQASMTLGQSVAALQSRSGDRSILQAALVDLAFWFDTLVSESSAPAELEYIQRMVDYIRSLYR